LLRALFISTLFLGALGAQSWQAAKSLPGVDLTGLTPDQKSAALKVLREESCNCGCSMKIAECRFKDPECGYSRSLAAEVVKDLKAGKTLDQVRVIVAELAKQAPAARKVLEDPVPIEIQGDPFRGPANAKVTIVEFSDFQCPYCAMAAPKALSLIDRFPNDVKVVFKQFPLDMHSRARMAAEASLAAHNQGKFWPMHDKLFGNFRQISRENVLKWASECGVDMARFTQDLDSKKYAGAVENEVNQGMEAGVMGTPTFFIDGKRYNGAMEPDVVAPLIEAELHPARAAAAKR
jgi:protein-disulfide isomerase